MSSIGPDLPPHLLAKRKRQAEEGDATKEEPKPDSPPRSPDGPDKRRRMMGPAAPPASLDEMPSKPVESDEDSESSDDDYGPSIPTGETPAVSSLFK
jgi:hypothetical protein